MKLVITTLLILIAGFIIAGCSDVGFKSVPKLSCENVTRDQTTTCVNQTDTVTVSFTFGVGDVDILFIDDNSGSMFAEQKKMASAFPTFLSNISNLFYQIAIVTTDISVSPNNSTPRAANGMGKFQDGQFLEFTDEQLNPSGLKVLSKDTPNVSELFKGTIKRQESLNCDNSGFNPAQCPSSDERGIYAANLAIKRGEGQFFRPGAHLAVVILSDENERGNPGAVGNPELESNDLPETLITNLKNTYPTKSISVHSVVTNNDSCRLQQTQTSANGIWPTLGFIGREYMKLSTPSADLKALGNLVPGVVGSICASDYGSQLGDISVNIKNNTLDAPKQLACTPDPATIHIETQPSGFENQVQYDIDDNNKIYFYNLPFGIKVTFSYDCPRF
jgi:hypothetical protein